MEKLLEGKNALVTGSGAGIGKSIAVRMAENGANIAVADISLETAEKTAAELRELGVKAKAYFSDISKIETDEALIDAVEADFGPLDILVNNAGISLSRKVLELTPEEWDRVQGINLRGTFFMSQTVFRRMMERKKGRIINIASISGDRPADSSDPSYCASKAGIIMLSKVYAKAAASTEITVNSVSPGLIETELGKKLGLAKLVTPEKVPMNRMGQPEEVAGAVVFLASDLASYVNGQNIRVNGGQFML